MRKNLKTITELIEVMKKDINLLSTLEEYTNKEPIINIFKNMEEILENLAIEVKNIKDVMENVTLNAEETGERMDMAEMVLCDIIECFEIDEDDDDEDFDFDEDDIE